ncbi:MAG: hypothetical protein IJ772_05350 [Bacilli bacterium]|nr:hypothetical protein [Bacilli bacterium]
MNDKKERFSNWCRGLCGREEIPYDEDEEDEIFYMKTCDPYILSYYYS